MPVICTKCGSTNVTCEAIINPNTKEVQDFVEDAFSDGYCQDCGAGVILTNPAEVLKEIEQKHKEFTDCNHRKPKLVGCHIAWKDDNNNYDVKIQLSKDLHPQKEDDIFYYCSLADFKSFTQANKEDFIVTRCHYFE